MSPHRLRHAALHLSLRRSERGPLYFHHGLLGFFIKGFRHETAIRMECSAHKRFAAPVSY